MPVLGAALARIKRADIALGVRGSFAPAHVRECIDAGVLKMRVLLYKRWVSAIALRIDARRAVLWRAHIESADKPLDIIERQLSRVTEAPDDGSHRAVMCLMSGHYSTRGAQTPAGLETALA